jgi:hypothetical protein
MSTCKDCKFWQEWSKRPQPENSCCEILTKMTPTHFDNDGYGPFHSKVNTPSAFYCSEFKQHGHDRAAFFPEKGTKLDVPMEEVPDARPVWYLPLTPRNFPGLLPREVNALFRGHDRGIGTFTKQPRTGCMDRSEFILTHFEPQGLLSSPPAGVAIADGGIGVDEG